MISLYRWLGVTLLATMLATQARAIEVKEVALTKETQAWVIEDHYLPIVSIKLAFRHSGAAYTQTKPGLAYMVSNLLDEGAGDLDSLSFKQALEQDAIEMGFEVDQDYLYVSVKTLQKHIGKALQLLKLALTQPQFNEQVVERVRGQLVTSIQRQEKQPGYIASSALQKAIYGDHPYALPVYGSIEALRAITIADLKAYVADYVTLDNLVIGVVGDVTDQTIRAQLRSLVDNLPQKAIQIRPLAPVIYPKQGQTIHIDYPVPQNTIVFAMQAPKRQDPEFYDVFILNYILGGGTFESRLMQTVREKKGLAYHISTSLDFSEASSVWVGSAATRNDMSHETVKLIRQELTQLQEKGITEAELSAAKQYLVGSFPLRLRTNSNLAGFLVVMQLEHLGIDFLNKRNDYIQSVGIEEINRTAYEYSRPDKLVTVVVGK